MVAARCKYLRKIKEYRQEQRNIVFMDETWINAHHTKEKEWTSKDLSQRRQVLASKGQRLIICHAGSAEEGFVENADLVFKSKSTDNRDYHTEMDGHNFTKWVSAKLLPNVKEKSVFVLDNASYHNVVDKEDQIPTNAWKKADIMEWFRRNGIPFPEKSFKYELLARIKTMSLKKVYAVDKLFTAAGHDVLRLPPYHSHLNPIELVWAQVKGQVADENTSFKLDDVKTLTHKALAAVDIEKWRKCAAHVEREEQNYWDRDGLGFVQPTTIVNVFDSDSE